MKTAQGLVDYVKKALSEKWGYVLGSYGNTATRSFLDNKYKQGLGVGAYNTKHKVYIETYLNKRVSDCYGLVKGYVWTENNGEPKYNANNYIDRNQEGAFSSAKEKGPLSTIPEIPGIILWMSGHAGVYIGNGEFIECRGCPVGMSLGKIQNGKVVKGSKFTHWFKDSYIDYSLATQVNNLDTALSVLEGKGILTKKDYWGKEISSGKIKYLDDLIIKIANYIK